MCALRTRWPAVVTRMRTPPKRRNYANVTITFYIIIFDGPGRRVKPVSPIRGSIKTGSGSNIEYKVDDDRNSIWKLAADGPLANSTLCSGLVSSDFTIDPSAVLPFDLSKHLRDRSHTLCRFAFACRLFISPATDTAPTGTPDARVNFIGSQAC